MNNKTNIPFNSIDYKDYDFGSAKIFFGFEDDWTRLIIIIFIILSLAIDIIITIILFFYKKKKNFLYQV
jgi:predicted membrane protein